MNKTRTLVLDFRHLRRDDVSIVGGKNASLGEMISQLAAEGIAVPSGFATSADAYWSYVEFNNIRSKMANCLDEWQSGKTCLAETGRAVRDLFLRGDWPQDVAQSITTAYRGLEREAGQDDLSVAVRSSATAEDLPDASFAGQQETFLNVQGADAVLRACRRCYASLFTDRALSYRQLNGFDHMKVALSIGVQRMVRTDLGSSGVMFSIDTDTGFDKVVLINAAWGLGENVVQGAVDPDEYQLFKPFLADERVTPVIERRKGEKAIKMVFGDAEHPTRNVSTSRKERDAYVLGDDDLLQLARWAVQIEKHYGCAMDMEWGKDGLTGELFILQARPETIQSRREGNSIKTYSLSERGEVLCKGLAIGDGAVTGRICLIESAKDIDRFVDGSILVTEITDPDWTPVMKRAAAIITDHGGRTSHAAIVSRELGLPAVVGVGNATYLLHDGQDVTVSCAEGDEGIVYAGTATIEASELDMSSLPETKTQIMLNLANPGTALRWWRLPSDGIGLARMEFVVSNTIKVHPMALVNFDQLKSEEERARIETLTADYTDKKDYFVDNLARGLARLCAVAHPKPIIIRMSDFKSNEYAGLLGGRQFELDEENPMIGFRGASRYYSPRYRQGFELECQAIKRLRDELGFTNAVVMIPFCRTVEEAIKVLGVMADNGLKRGDKGLEVYVMCEIPSNVILAADYADHFDGFSIGSNDLTQLTLGVDRDSELLSGLFDEQNAAVKWMIRHVIEEAREKGCKVGLCGQAPSDHPEFADFLVECGISSISVTPDSFLAVKLQVAQSEQKGQEAQGAA
ncbi:phosphoenolpyruvate synthase [Cohaesibacter sp. CAU 1516]|uniref:phosphoenolpyruvate synthase n=1 Tax=Cohaesibacter sp. CAU 1516 TaxID=2576038 RepID=UPI0010FE700F|nr:phosphoenolpyruvate synthase [Cohaesibacter sp. CAU 1516]TLP44759.1 phosphoenolpyruvate synthase [Cohaesibacter sp. CAU 1516]